jgi:nucleotide-binding universal stress UspA family protein
MKILLATDGSEHSERAASFLTGLNVTKDDEIMVLHAFSWAPVISEWELVYADLKEIREEIAPKILASTVSILSSVNARVTSSIEDGYPEKVIIDKAHDAGADLIVMGGRGFRGAVSLIVGSVTKVVAVKSAKPVLIIKFSQKAESDPMKIIFATDGSVHSDGMMKVLCSVPFPDDTEIVILNVVTTAFKDIPERFAIEINDRIKCAVADARKAEFKESAKITRKASEYLSKRFSKIEKLTKIGDPSEEILNTSDEINADIIAVGNSGMRGIRGILGSVTRYVLNHSKCSVLIGRTE